MSKGCAAPALPRVVNTIRLGLIGGGANPEEASALINAYVKAHPLGEVHLLALDILNDLWTGPAEQSVNEAAATGDLSSAVGGGAV